jgi:uncharacterized repeat protein (TIGR03803 family)
MKKLLVILFFTLSSSPFTLCKAQYSDLLNFNRTNGAYPYGSLTLLGKSLYGMTVSGNNIFSIDTNGNSYRNLVVFNGANGANPYGNLMFAGGKFYGMTSDGGANGDGNIFSVDTNGNNIKDIFDFNGVNGLSPLGSLIISGKVLYGMTQLGLSPNNYGNIFRIDTDGNNFKVLLEFNKTNGAYPEGSLTLSGKVLYAMALQGGANNDGCVFSIDTDGSKYSDMLDFNGTNGSGPGGSLIYASGLLYGMTNGGGVHSAGCIFSIDTNGSKFKDLFDFSGKNGLGPTGSLFLSGSILFGMTCQGGAKHDSGCIFNIDTAGNGYKDLLDFDGLNGEHPNGDLTLSGSVLYGMTSDGGVDGYGVVFKLDTTNISSSINELIVGSDGIIVYPNPNKGIFIISLSNSSLVSESQTKLEVYDILGEKIFEEMLSQVQHVKQVDLSSQPTGVYLYRVLNENGVLAGQGKLVINK